MIETQARTLPQSSDRLSDSLDYFLIEATGKIQLTKSQRDDAKARYESAADCLRNAPSSNLLYHADQRLEPIGSLGSDTTTKPTKYEEFDLDLLNRISNVQVDSRNIGMVHRAMYDRFYENKIFRPLLEPFDKFDRCIRLSYAGQFHTDLMAGVPYNPADPNDTRVWIAERRKDGLYHPRLVDPLGLIRWLNTQAKIQKVIKNLALDEARGTLEAMPILTEGVQKPVLKQVIQLIKRGRDTYFAKDDEAKKILKSVLILTVAGNSYDGETSLALSTLKTAKHILHQTRDLATIKILNPVNPTEDFAESLRRHPERHEKLQSFLHHFIFQMNRLFDARLSLAEREKVLEALFGELQIKAVFDEYGKRMADLNKKNRMSMTSGGLIGASAGKSGLRVPQHAFYGDE